MGEERVRVCNGGRWSHRDDMPLVLRRFYPKKWSLGFSCGCSVQLNKNTAVCDMIEKPLRCPLSDGDYNKLPTISRDKAFETLTKG